MTNAEMKTIYANADVAEADIEKILEKYDFDKINEIINSSANPKVALEQIHAFYPELEVAKMQEQMDFIQSQIETAFSGEKTDATIELTEDELDSVVGGGWWSDNWDKVVGATVGAIILGAIASWEVGSMFAPAGPVGAIVGGVVGGAIGIALGASIGWNYKKIVDQWK